MGTEDHDDEHSVGSSNNSMGKQSVGGGALDDSSTGSGLQDASSLTSGTSGTGHSSSANKGGIPEAVFATKETHAIQCSRCLVFSFLLISAVAAGVMAFFLTKASEKEDFETQFQDFAFEIDDVSQKKASNVYLAIETFSATITSHTLSKHQVWPNVTLPHFEKHGELLQLSTGAQAIAFAPVVTDLHAWNQYSVENEGWVQESYELRDDSNPVDPIPKQMYLRTKDGTMIPQDDNQEEYVPLWQEGDAPQDTSVLNFNLLSHDIFARVFRLMRDTKGPVLSEVLDVSELFGYEALLETNDGKIHPESFLADPVYDDFDKSNVVGTAIAVIPWDTYFGGLLHEGANGVLCVLRDTCGDVFTYRIDGPVAHYIDEGDLHDSKYDYLEHTVPFGPTVDFTHADDDAEDEHCVYTMHLYPTLEFEEAYYTAKPVIFTIVVVVVFVFTSLVFILYDYLVQKRQEKVHNHALKSNAIISSLFPAKVRDRLFQQQSEGSKDKKAKNGKTSGGRKGDTEQFSAKNRLKTYLDGDELKKPSEETADNSAEMGPKADMYESKPIADLFPNTTVMFADIAGFTAWSSVREPSQVFTLLETVYRAFDIIAKRRHVFKVETVGDCYVAVTGLPEARKDHAVGMARFARECMQRMNELTSQLEVSLGPDTGDLAMRMGLHSGPVTAGVLRGDKSRFQLFGDTVNTAARVESTGVKGQIQLSEETADLLKDAGKEKWFVPRTDRVHAKGKGSMKTYWLLSNGTSQSTYFAANPAEPSAKLEKKPSNNLVEVESIVPSQTQISPKIKRLIDWNVEILRRLLKLVVEKRVATKMRAGGSSDQDVTTAEKKILRKGGMVLDEVAEIVALPKFNAKLQKTRPDPKDAEIPKSVLDQLREYVESLAGMYRDNPFHNFEHASHVTMSVSKLLARIVAPDIDVDEKNLASDLHDHTYGITSDPLTQFAVVISALVHDADHVGLPNFLLIDENEDLASRYQKKSVAEQNSVDLAWKMLMEKRFAELRSYIYTDVEELQRFRQLLANTVLATDIFDKELSAQRKARWAKAFSSKTLDSETTQEATNRKATIVIEHLIQASDVAHTMQHWHIYTKWNERLFAEMYSAYKMGRSSKDPSEGWYNGELGFFDGYVIPLAKKLKECGVFGVSSDEYLNYALENRREWATKGAELVGKLVEKYGEGDSDTLERRGSVVGGNTTKA